MFHLHQRSAVPSPFELTRHEMQDAVATLRGWAGYAATPLHRLHSFPAASAVWLKEESQRFGVGNFKPPGAAYALTRLLRERRAGTMVVTASAGNYGRSLAWAARQLDLPCTIYVGDGVSAASREAIQREGASILQVVGTYDDAVRTAAAAARGNGWTLVSDTAFDGYEEIPRFVMAGYALLLDEVETQLRPTHVFVPGGVGGLAAAVAAYYAQAGGARPRIIVVEPRASDCLLQSSIRGARAVTFGAFDTQLVPLACGEPSTLAWRILADHADAFIAITDEEAIEGAERMRAEDSHPSVGLCAGATAGALLSVLKRKEHAAALDLTGASNVLLIGTDGKS
ncbi:pyridoxal-phosphate dependent enzyme [Roseiterribacter gracilis]|uniref:PLP-dependent lyase/thiolase n=1 Tax=Roseiterribacter gracilis TaxID=2812848 RepID=A0A8S8X6U8_9PROT|nr:PLP-dependent lyase/thiolase [Rhodospirillales bacterium TMPK1]